MNSTVPPNRSNLFHHGNRSTYQHLFNARFLTAVHEFGSIKRNNIPLPIFYVPDDQSL